MARADAAGRTLLSAAQAAELLGQPEADVLADAAAGNLTWVTEADVTLYHEDTARALLARRNPPVHDPLISRAEAAAILGVGSSGAARLLTRDPDAIGAKSYRLSAVEALRAERAANPRTLKPGHKAALLAGRETAAALKPGPLSPDEVFRAQAAHRARQDGAP